MLLAGAALFAWACVDMSAPKGPAAISLLQLPALFVVLGDTMRDTNGVAATPSLIAFDAAGTPTTATGAQFFTTDTLPVATFNAAGQLVAKSVGSVHIIGQIGQLQTPPVTVTVTTSGPDSIESTPADSTLHAVFNKDSAAGRAPPFPLSVIVRAADHTPMPGVFVTFSIAQHSTTQKYPAVFLTDDNSSTNAFFPVDTTDASGTASKSLVVITNALDPNAVAAGDTAVITVSAKYKGAPLKGSPLTLKIPIKVSF